MVRGTNSPPTLQTPVKCSDLVEVYLRWFSKNRVQSWHLYQFQGAVFSRVGGFSLSNWSQANVEKTVEGSIVNDKCPKTSSITGLGFPSPHPALRDKAKTAGWDTRVFQVSHLTYQNQFIVCY